MFEQTIRLAARATAFTAVCEACAAEHGYHAAHLEGRLALDRDHGSALCPRGHDVRVERAGRAPVGVVPHAA